MRVHISSGLGTGPTELAAFNAALLSAGIGTFNLLPLTSVIPANTEVVRGHVAEEGQWGDRLYVVIAERRESRPGFEAWAGLGWVQDADGRGLFVEHCADSRRGVERLIEETLTAMVKAQARSFGVIQSEVVGVACEAEPVCALVAARYKTEGWD